MLHERYGNTNIHCNVQNVAVVKNYMRAHRFKIHY